jgi:DNA-binding response OmpR family regulator
MAARSSSRASLPRVLFIEADTNAAEAVHLALHDDIIVETALIEGVALDHARVESYDAILLDAAASSDGLEKCRRLRRNEPQIPILMLVDPESFEQRGAALDAGADDYLSRTAPADELTARLRTLMERASRTGPRILHAAGIELNADAHQVTVDANQVHLSPREFDLLEFFMSNPDKALSREEILDGVWDFAYKSNVVDVYVRYLRDKIDEGVIETVRGVGYRFSPDRRPSDLHIDLTDRASNPSVITD